jgi:hypothetical protein
LKENSWTAITMTSRDIHSDIREGRERKLKRKNKKKHGHDLGHGHTGEIHK